MEAAGTPTLPPAYAGPPGRRPGGDDDSDCAGSGGGGVADLPSWGSRDLAAPGADGETTGGVQQFLAAGADVLDPVGTIMVPGIAGHSIPGAGGVRGGTICTDVAWDGGEDNTELWPCRASEANMPREVPRRITVAAETAAAAAADAAADAVELGEDEQWIGEDAAAADATGDAVVLGEDEHNCFPSGKASASTCKRAPGLTTDNCVLAWIAALL